MDGTLLDGDSQVLPSSVEALHAALAAGVTVCLATGKARPAALSAMQKVGLAGSFLYSTECDFLVLSNPENAQSLGQARRM